MKLIKKTCELSNITYNRIEYNQHKSNKDNKSIKKC